MKFRLLLITILAGILLVACSSMKTSQESVADFTYTDQTEQEFSLDDLKGNIWLADFIFTNCGDVCMPMTANMKKLQDAVKEKGYSNVHFVSFSVDPINDTPKVLREYADKFNVDYSNWHFLTGYKQEQIEKFALDSFNALVKKPDSDDQVIHGTSFYLINQEGEIVKDYSGLSDMPLQEIIKDIQELQ